MLADPYAGIEAVAHQVDQRAIGADLELDADLRQFLVQRGQAGHQQVLRQDRTGRDAHAACRLAGLVREVAFQFVEGGDQVHSLCLVLDRLRGDVLSAGSDQDVLDAVLQDIRTESAERLIVSVVAGVPIARITNVCGAKTPVIRTMPNTPAMVHEGMTAIATGEGVGEDDTACVRQMFESVGKVVPVEERLMDAVTGLSGSGPAYVFLAIEALTDGGVKMGLSRETAGLLAALRPPAPGLFRIGEQRPGDLDAIAFAPAGAHLHLAALAGAAEVVAGGPGRARGQRCAASESAAASASAMRSAAAASAPTA